MPSARLFPGAFAPPWGRIDEWGWDSYAFLGDHGW